MKSAVYTLVVIGPWNLLGPNNMSETRQYPTLGRWGVVGVGQSIPAIMIIVVFLLLEYDDENDGYKSDVRTTFFNVTVVVVRW